MKYRLLIFTLFIVLQMSAQEDTGSIVGKLTDKEFNNEPLAFANLLIKGTTKGTTSDFDGLFEIANVDPGTYTLVISFLGYETLEVPNVVVEVGKITEINAALGASSVGLDEVVVTTSARKDSEIALLLQQKRALVMQEAISAEALTLKGIDDAAAAVAQISGISKQQGSSNVYVRGLGDRYQNTTMNGLSLPSNDVSKKNIDLDLFSSSIIENVSVSKAYNPTFYGDFSAGNVNIDSKEYTGDGYVEISLGSGFNSNATGEGFVRSEGPSNFGFYNRYDNDPFAVVLSHGVDPQEAWNTINISGAIEGGYSFDFNNDNSRLSFFGAASFNNGFQLLEGPARDFTNVLKVDFPNVREFAYKTTTTALGNIIYKINNEHKLKYSSLFINNATDAVGYYGVNGLGTNRDAIITTDEGFYVMNVQFNQDMIFVNQLTGQHVFNDKLSLDWGAGFNKVFSDEPDRKRITLENYQLALDNDASTNPVFYTNIPFDNQRFFQSIEDDELNSFVNLGYQASEKVKFNFGYNGRKKERRFNSIRYGYEIQDRDNTPVTDVNNFNTIFDVSNINVPNGAGLWDLLVLNPINNEIGNRNRPGLPENTYKGNLDIHAVYAAAEIGLGEKLGIVPGIRVESYNQKVGYEVINIRADDPGSRSVYENIFLPSLNVRYALNDNSNLRFGFSKTASFPEFKEVAPFVYESVTQRIGGNPDLLGGLDGNGPTYSDIFNYDIKYEWFLERGEIISVAAFAKTIKDPINRVVAADATGTQRYFRTGEKADIYGAELEVRKNLYTDADDNAIVSVGLNAAYTHTEQDLQDIPGGSQNTFGTAFDRDSDELEGASPFIINTDLNYSPVFGDYKPKATIAFSYFSDRIFSLGSGSLGNIVEKAVPTLNLVLKNSFGEHFEANLSAKNILDSDITLVREGTDLGDIVIREYNLGVNVGLTLKYKF
ncbi:TonB-dependent receptor [Flagellimonas myxillae]|uniref:TonB-dependent receptor n=1 Tax=Flagellimonas myxillae TaxID=2942214 RepID=UPI00201F4416|nr:TonB-dependent receptor [Muricauda myxillae]MCL6267567.1 TonB-dependent receptor [Muricauda myxillae]